MQEAVRALRTSLQFSMRSTHDVIQITSSSQGEGKSTIAANLAVAMAGVGHPVLLVDADFRAPRQHSIFGLLNGQGLSTMMSMSGEDLDVPIQATAFKNLGVLTSGPLPPNPTEVMASRIESAIARLRELEWAIIIDTPPVLPVSDARLVAPKADLVLLVAVAGRTKPANLRTTVEQLLVTQATLAGVVLNQAKETSMYEGYGYYRALEPIEFAAHD
jgi:capsular exopolysaccharide synthesis family protein